MEQIKEKYERFKEWQVKPHEVAELTADKHECATCHTEFHGNYCPRCGQKSSVGRYSFKTAFLLFLDVWGLGNRGMFRTIRDLLFRPGYMIRDYLSGMQMAYFPPFKMFFLVITLSVLVQSGLNIRTVNTLKKNKEYVAKNLDINIKEKEDDKTDINSINEVAINDTIIVNGKPIAIKKDKNSDSIYLNGRKFVLIVFDIIKKVYYWVNDHETVVQFLLLIVLSGPMYFFFRKNKKIPDVRYSEFFVSMVYVTNLMTIIGIIGEFFQPGNSTAGLVAYAMSIVALKQLYGYNYKKTLFKVVSSFMLLIFAAATIGGIIAGLAYLYVEYIL
ncbi:MAG: DUF3667 domain-containing protein [Bacteroidaceae bacterium]|nr:DUF3667 domain-containing protein [Bacteroidaceae bacterium]